MWVVCQLLLLLTLYGGGVPALGQPEHGAGAGDCHHQVGVTLGPVLHPATQVHNRVRGVEGPLGLGAY